MLNVNCNTKWPNTIIGVNMKIVLINYLQFLFYIFSIMLFKNLGNVTVIKFNSLNGWHTWSLLKDVLLNVYDNNFRFGWSYVRSFKAIR